MKRSHRVRCVATSVLLVSLLSACDRNEEGTISVDGVWSGRAAFENFPTRVEMHLTTDQGGQVTGTGRVDGIEDGFSFNATGTYSFPDLALTLTSTFFDSKYTGVMSPDGRTITGTWTDIPRFESGSLRLSRNR